MKKLILLLTMAFVMSAGYAQNQPTPEQRAQAMTTSMMQHLRLSGAQAAKVKEINLGSIQMMEQAKKELKSEPRKLMAQMDLISSSRLSALKDVLTPTQFLQFNQHREKKMGLSSTGAGPAKRSVNEEYSN